MMADSCLKMAQGNEHHIFFADTVREIIEIRSLIPKVLPALAGIPQSTVKITQTAQSLESVLGN